ncbi:hypothetical protein [Chordicoccus furentiruminis]|uniref:hypothetical protein n=1 Tax=Chordicoccus furentiruminis TaxID=2709410 RepID=UPI0023A8B666|nr:hypothetical protein [Chordicoccus furentiruminis]
MEYGKGTIILKQGIIFKDNQSRDSKICHPAMIAIATDSITDETYYLTMTSQVHKYAIYEERYFLLGQDLFEIANLDRPSMINLQNIYKERIREKKVGGLPPRLYREVIRKFKQYQETSPDPLYAELKMHL